MKTYNDLVSDITADNVESMLFQQFTTKEQADKLTKEQIIGALQCAEACLHSKGERLRALEKAASEFLNAIQQMNHQSDFLPGEKHQNYISAGLRLKSLLPVN